MGNRTSKLLLGGGGGGVWGLEAGNGNQQPMNGES